jgi:hypothetical protein
MMSRTWDQAQAVASTAGVREDAVEKTCEMRCQGPMRLVEAQMALVQYCIGKANGGGSGTAKGRHVVRRFKLFAAALARHESPSGASCCCYSSIKSGIKERRFTVMDAIHGSKATRRQRKGTP